MVRSSSKWGKFGLTLTLKANVNCQQKGKYVCMFYQAGVGVFGALQLRSQTDLLFNGKESLWSLLYV